MDTHHSITDLFGPNAVLTPAGANTTLAIHISDLGNGGANISGTLTTEGLFMALLQSWYLRQFRDDTMRIVEITKSNGTQAVVNQETFNIENYNIKVYGTDVVTNISPDDV